MRNLRKLLNGLAVVAKFLLYTAPIGLLTALAIVVNFLVHYVVGPVLFGLLVVFGFTVEKLLTYLVVWPLRLLHSYVLLPVARPVAKHYVLHHRLPVVEQALYEFQRDFGLEETGSFSHYDLVFGPDRFHKGRAQMMVQTAESDLSCADEAAGRNHWFTCLDRLDRAANHLANARAEMNLIPQRNAAPVQNVRFDPYLADAVAV